MKYFYAEKWADKFNTYNIQGVNGKEMGTIKSKFKSFIEGIILRGNE